MSSENIFKSFYLGRLFLFSFFHLLFSLRKSSFSLGVCVILSPSYYDESFLSKELLLFLLLTLESSEF